MPRNPNTKYPASWRKMLSEIGKLGGAKRSKLPKAKRVAIAQKSAETRKKRKPKQGASNVD